MSKNIIIADVGELDGITTKDRLGTLHFNSDVTTEQTLLEKCKGLSTELTETLRQEFENLFAHKKFNGRSEVFYKFEGIGCIYWHQNAKLALAVLETAQREHDLGEIYDAYKQLMQGFIYRKTPAECGAIPIEPYSHSSYTGKSEQPGMTGQVKESIIMRRGELGVQINDGPLCCHLLKHAWSSSSRVCSFVSLVEKTERSMTLLKYLPLLTTQGRRNERRPY